MSRRGGGRPVWQRAVGGLVLAAAVLLVVEMGARLAGVAPAYTEDSIAAWRVAPDQLAVSTRGPRDGHAFTVTTNGDGLRTTVAEARTPGVQRVVILGDSTVFGWGVDDGGTVADGLADALAESHPEVGPVEVINAGQPGYSTYQAAWLMETVLAAWEPDLTVLFVPLHDANLVLVSDREQLLGAASPGAAVRILLARHSRLYQVLRQALYTQSANPSVVPQHATDGEPRVPRVSDAERSEAIARVAELASTWGGHLGVGLLPFQGDLVRREPTDRPSAGWASTETSAQGLLLLDARACCGPHGGHLVLADDPGHLTAEGNRLVGASMAPEVAAALTGRP